MADHNEKASEDIFPVDVEKDATNIAWKMHNEEQRKHEKTFKLYKEFEKKCEELEMRIAREEKDLLTRIRDQERRLDNIIKTLNNQVMPVVKRNMIMK